MGQRPHFSRIVRGGPASWTIEVEYDEVDLIDIFRETVNQVSLRKVGANVGLRGQRGIADDLLDVASLSLNCAIICIGCQ